MDFVKLNGHVKILNVAKKVECKTSKLVEENKLIGVWVGSRVDPKDGKKRELKKNTEKAQKRGKKWNKIKEMISNI